MKVLMVCTGNLCRSPMAEALLRNELERRGCGEIEVASAGTWAGFGHPATGDAISVLAERGIDLTSHRSRPLLLGELQAADLVVAMTSVHVAEILELAPNVRGRLVLLKQIAGIARELPADVVGPNRIEAFLDAPRPPWRREADLDDPIGLPLTAYLRCAREIEEGIGALADLLC